MVECIFAFMVVLLFVFWAEAASMKRLPNPSTAISAKAKDTFLMIVAPLSIRVNVPGVKARIYS
jgi:hypothetical protein